MEILNNRELAFLIWIVIFLIGLFVYPPTREAIPGLLRSAFLPKLSTIYGIMLAYSVGMVLILYNLDLWDDSQLKNTILWFLTVGLISLSDLTKDNQPNYFKKTVKDIFSFTAILQLIIGVYTFSLLAELIIIPLGALISGMIAVAGQNTKHASVKKVLESALTLWGLYVFGYTIYKIATDFMSFANEGTLNDFMIPGTLSIMFLPLIYILSVYITRENTFVGLSNVLKEPKLLRYAKWQTLLHFAFNRDDLKRWKRLAFLRTNKTNEDVRNSIKFIKLLKKTEKNPPDVIPKEGWSPYKAKDILTEEGIVTNYYQPLFDYEWSASSEYIKLDEEFIANNIAYYIEGNERAAKKLKLVLNIYDPIRAKEAHNKLLKCSKLLYKFATNTDLPKHLEAVITKGKKDRFLEGNKCIVVSKDLWAGHKMNGYNLSFSVTIIDDNK